MVSGNASYSYGNDNTILVDNSFAIGNNITIDTAGNTVNGNVVLGNASADKAFVEVDSATVQGRTATLNADGTVTYTEGPSITYNGFAGTAVGVVSVGALGAERQIVNVAAGEISATSTDAINGSQLFAVANTISGQVTTIVNNAQTHYYSVNDNGVTTGGNYNNDGATGVNAIAAGVGASATAESSVAMGTGANSGAAGAIAIGSGAQAIGNNAALGGQGAGAVAIGNGAGAASSSVSIGESVGSLTSYGSVAIGSVGNGSVGGLGNGTGSLSSGSDLIAIGTESGIQVTGSRNVAIGGEVGNNVVGSDNVAIAGVNAGVDVTGNNNLALGNNAGNGVSASGTISIGTSSKASALDAVAIGSGATATITGNVALGANAVDKAAVQVTSATVQGRTATLNADGTVTYVAGPAVTYSGFAGTASGVISVGSLGAERQIVNVAAGEISATSTDAINGSQLYAVAAAINGSVTNIVNNAQTHYYSVNDSGINAGNYANDGATGSQALAAGMYTVASASNAIAVGSYATASGEKSIALGHSSQANGANSASLGNGSQADGNASIAIGFLSAAVGENSIAIGLSSRVIGADAVALGTSSGSVANGVALGSGSQAQATANGIGYVPPTATAAQQAAIAATTIGNLAPVSVGNAFSTRQIQNVAAGTLDSDAVNVAQLKATVTTAVGSVSMNFAGNSGDSVAVANGGTLAITGEATTAGAYTGANIKTVTDTTTGAINIQMAENPEFTSVTTGNTTINNNGLTINNGPSVTSTGIDANNTLITNVAPGVAGTDAVNVNQLNGVTANINNHITSVGNIANAGVAQAIAAAGLPQAYLPGKSMVAISGGTYEGEAGYAIGVSSISDNGKWVIKASGSGNSRGKYGASIGAGYQW